MANEKVNNDTLTSIARTVGTTAGIIVSTATRLTAKATETLKPAKPKRATKRTAKKKAAKRKVATKKKARKSSARKRR